MAVPPPPPVCSGNRPRTHARLPVALRVAPLHLTPHEWRTVNISEGGVFVQSVELLPPGSMLDLGLWLASERITSKVQVVWTNDPSRPGSDASLPVGMGLRFLGLGERDRRVFRQFLRDLTQRLTPEARAAAPRGATRLPPPELPWVASVDVQLDPPSAVESADSELLAPVLPAGTVLGSYRIIRRLGCGGMGDVYVAEHLRLGRRVAVKRLHPRFASDRVIAARFLGEARVVNQIDHPNIVEITDFCSHGDQPYFVMELLTGQSLAEAIGVHGALPLKRLLHIGAQLSASLEAVHGKGVVHRDLKPQNIFLTERDGQPDFVKLLDFGVAKHRGPTRLEDGACTQEGMVVGTPGYVAPEQLDGTPADCRSDIYAFGIVLFQMATGRAPFVADTWGKLILQQLTQRPPRPSTVAGRPFPEQLEELILACLDPTPARRPASMAVIRAALVGLAARLADPTPVDGRVFDAPPSFEIEVVTADEPERSARGTDLRPLLAMLALVATIAFAWRWHGSVALAPPASPAVDRAAVELTPPTTAHAAEAAAAVCAREQRPSVVGAASSHSHAVPVPVVAASASDDGEPRRVGSRGNRRRARLLVELAAVSAVDAAPTPGEPSAPAVSNDRDDARDHYQRGLAHLRARKVLLAIGELEQVVALDPDHASAHRLLGTAYGLVGREQKMVESWRRYLSLMPSAQPGASAEPVAAGTP